MLLELLELIKTGDRSAGFTDIYELLVWLLEDGFCKDQVGWPRWSPYVFAAHPTRKI